MIGPNSYVREKVKEEIKYYIIGRFCSYALIMAFSGFIAEGTLLIQLDKLSNSRDSSSLHFLLERVFRISISITGKFR